MFNIKSLMSDELDRDHPQPFPSPYCYFPHLCVKE